MREIVTTFLDFLAVLLFAAGAAWCAGVYLGWCFSLLAGGVVVLVGSWVADASHRKGGGS